MSTPCFCVGRELQVLETRDETETREKKLAVRVGKGALRLAVRRLDEV